MKVLFAVSNEEISQAIIKNSCYFLKVIVLYISKQNKDYFAKMFLID